mgnify:CR=1 FL=1
MRIRLPWLISRRKLLISCIYEIVLIYLLNVYIFSEYFVFAKNIKFFTLLFIPLWLLLSYLFGRYSYEEEFFKNKKNNIFIQLYLRTLLVSMTSIFAIFIVFENINLNNFNHYDQIIVIYSAQISFIINLLQFPLINTFIRKTLSKEYWIFIGSDELYQFLNNELEFSRKKVKLLNKGIDLKLSEKNFHKIKGIIIDKVEDINQAELNKFFEFQKKGKEIISAEMWCELNLQRFPSEMISKEFFLKGNFSTSYNSFQLRFKRIGDVLFSVVLLVVTTPIVLISGLIIYLEDKSNFIYLQERVGLNKKKFILYKLRTMIPYAEKGKPKWASKYDKRITKIGGFLRKTRIDELPQLLNVIKGDMSLIGPRPEREVFDKELKKFIPYYDFRYSLKPGLSGWAQVNFPYGSSLDDAKKKFGYDLFYLRNFSIWLDFLILFKTIRIVFLKKGSIPNN